ncbi:MAG: hypothetical protein JNJ90_01660 [Saprospiraceae bacterium]|jgi:hypothetical protein|nr:hypothetical protein [Saprospiraceae bacterium]
MKKVFQITTILLLLCLCALRAFAQSQTKPPGQGKPGDQKHLSLAVAAEIGKALGTLALQHFTAPVCTCMPPDKKSREQVADEYNLPKPHIKPRPIEKARLY